MSRAHPTLNDITILLSPSVCEQMIEDIAANNGAEVLWWGKFESGQTSPSSHSEHTEQSQDSLINFVEAAACGNEEGVLAHFPYMERGDVVLHNHPSGTVQPSDADLVIAAELAMQGIGFYIVDNQLHRICVVAKAVAGSQEQALDLEQLSALLGPDGPLARKASREKVDRYEERPAQQELLRLVASGFNQDKIVVAEGGTGIGKSFAYLLPAAFWACSNKQRVLVSTATIHLQQQLIEKDIPAIREISGLHDLQAELVKGRSNYLCLRRLKQAEEEESSSLGFAEEQGQGRAAPLFQQELASIRQWAAVTQDGSLSDLSFRPQSAVWQQVCGESDNCLGLRCEFHEQCFIIQARRRAAAAHILVVNHHLLFADLELREGAAFGYEKTAVLPPYRHVVLDEAHNIERSAQSFFSTSLHRFSAQRSLRRLYFRYRNREGGLWTQLRRYAELELSEPGDLPDIPACNTAIEEALEALDNAAKQVLDSAPTPSESRQSKHLRIPEQHQNLPAQVQQALEARLWPQLQQLSRAVQALLQAQRKIYELLENVLENEEQKLLLEWRQLMRRFEALRSSVLQWQDYLDWEQKSGRQEPESMQPQAGEAEAGHEMERVFWLEKRQRSAQGSPQYYQHLISTQINIGGLLQQVLFQPMRSVVLVSATLTVRGRFDYWCSRIGLSAMLEECRASREAGEATGDVDFASDFAASEANQGADPAANAGRILFDSAELRASSYASPFDYSSRVKLLLASDAPNPSFSREFDNYVARFAQQALHSLGGRSLLLFTSYASLHKCYQFLGDDATLTQDLLRQGDDDSARLLQQFKEHEHLSLLATDSFWEGVDAPGATLMQVLICRLPFRSPDEPIVAAHTEYLERRGENAFFNYSLPEAILRFRQGFGRLMRRGSDQGLVVVLDPRIVSKRYGQDFINSLPPAQVLQGDFAVLQQYIREYAAEHL